MSEATGSHAGVEAFEGVCPELDWVRAVGGARCRVGDTVASVMWDGENDVFTVRITYGAATVYAAEARSSEAAKELAEPALALAMARGAC